MKTNFLNGLFAIILILSFGCSNEPDNEIIYTVGYIMDYDNCAAFKERGETTAKARGYYIISENLKDTLLTYNLPDDLFEFPLAFFGYAGSEHSYRYDYKMRFTYRPAEEDEKIFPLCPAIYQLLYPGAKQIIINAVSNSGAINWVEVENPYRETVIGKWKLMQISIINNTDTQDTEIIDCSSDSIIYDFLINNKLEVSGYIPDDLAEGGHLYQYQKLNVGQLSLPGPNLTIDNDNLLFCITRADDDTMTIKGEKITGRIVDEAGLIVEQGTVVTWSKTFIKLN